MAFFSKSAFVNISTGLNMTKAVSLSPVESGFARKNIEIDHVKLKV